MINPHAFRALRGLFCLLALVALMAATEPANADIRTAGREIVAEYGDAILTVRIVLNQKMSQGGESEQHEVKNESSGTVLTVDGLTLVPLDAIDPSQMIRRVYGDQINIESHVKDIKLVVGKRQEIPATVVLRDNDLGIAFLKPTEKPEKPFKHIDFTNNTEPELLEQVMVLARMGRIADRQIGAMTGEIQAIVKKPRMFYVPSAELASGGFGVPIFSEAKKVVGVVLMRTLPSGASDSGEGMLGIILPAADIVEIANQADEPEEE